MKKHVLARALALVMSLSLLSSTALAAVAFDPNSHVGEDGSLLQNAEANYDYYLDKDIELNQTLVIKDGVDASIDLNGFTLSGNGESSVIKVTGNGTSLTLDNTQVGGTESGENGTITGGGGNTGGGVHVNDHASVTMNGGTITGNNVGQNGGGVFIQNGGPLTLEEGGFSGNNAGPSGGGGFFWKTGRAAA